MELVQALLAKGGWLLGYLLPFLFALTVVVFFHELGHFWVARRCGVKIDAFSVGFGPELFGFNDRHGTRWRFAAIPLGGYVRFHGDDSAASTPNIEALEKMSEADKKVSFFHQPVRNRAAIVAAGPIANFILAIVIFAGSLYIYGRTLSTPVAEVVRADGAAYAAGIRHGDKFVSVDGKRVDGYEDVMRAVVPNSGRPLEFVVERKNQLLTFTVTPGTREVIERGVVHKLGDIGIVRWPSRVGDVIAGGAAEKAGLKRGDRIVAIDGAQVAAFDDVVRVISANPGKQLLLTIERDGKQLKVNATPQPRKEDPKIGMLGFSTYVEPADTFRKYYGLISPLQMGVSETWFVVEQTMIYIGKIFVGKESIDQLGGPLRIAQVAGDVTARGGLEHLIRLTAVLSVSIGLLNLFPIPLLDGGHLLFYLIEAVRGRPLSERAQEYGFRIGFAMVMLLMIVATWNDIFQIFIRT
ncbi:MAG: RIP metalloprotease RseP [Xanthobacteraceae bacterium]|nr:RIP metalloprotease RseP [Xanthobacteraceae bacterium]QYK46456.1 MAG: RIP metalloprotease RseP [Xanthobacteraceae bacterium]HMN51334.1 RIP metalloprotease RseP [Xanthobacteraceae bacterium]